MLYLPTTKQNYTARHEEILGIKITSSVRALFYTIASSTTLYVFKVLIS